jgi:hypothetical protein
MSKETIIQSLPEVSLKSIEDSTSTASDIIRFVGKLYKSGDGGRQLIVVAPARPGYEPVYFEFDAEDVTEIKIEAQSDSDDAEPCGQVMIRKGVMYRMVKIFIAGEEEINDIKRVFRGGGMQAINALTCTCACGAGGTTAYSVSLAKR